MKRNIIKIICFVMAALTMLSIFIIGFTGCKKKTEEETTVPETTEVPLDDIELTTRASHSGSDGGENLITIEDNGEYHILEGYDLD